MPLGANITYPMQRRINVAAAKLMGQRALTVRNGISTRKRWGLKTLTTAPTDSEAGDVSNHAGDIILHQPAGVATGLYYVKTAATPDFTTINL